MGAEQVGPVEPDAVGDADVADRTAGPHGADRLLHRLPGADAFQDAVGAQTVGQLLDVGHAVLAAFGHDVGGAELAGQPLAARVPAYGNNPLGAELFGGQHSAQADRAVTDHDRGVPGRTPAATARTSRCP